MKIFLALTVLITSSVAIAGYPECPGGLHHCTCCEWPNNHCKVDKKEAVKTSGLEQEQEHEEDLSESFVEDLKSGELLKVSEESK